MVRADDRRQTAHGRRRQGCHLPIFVFQRQPRTADENNHETELVMMKMMIDDEKELMMINMMINVTSGWRVLPPVPKEGALCDLNLNLNLKVWLKLKAHILRLYFWKLKDCHHNMIHNFF